MATRGGARLLGREDIGSLEEGRACDLFMLDERRLELVGACVDAGSMLAAVGVPDAVDMTIVNGRVTVRGGRLTGIDEEKTALAAQKKCSAYLG